MTKQLIGIDHKLLHLKSLKETPGNPQRMDDKTFTGIVESMKNKGWLLDSPVIWKKGEDDYQIISGHHRVMAGIKAGIVETQCKVIEGINDEQAKILVLEANQRKGSFDDEILNIFIDDLVENYDYNIDEIIDEVGFDDDILNSFIDDDNEKDDEVPEIKEEVFSKPGDLYLLNGHRVLCGDSTDEGQVAVLMDGKKADMVFTDPPYDGKIGGRGEFKKNTEQIKKLYTFDPSKLFEIYKTIKKDKINGYFFCNKILVPKYLNYAVENDIKFFILSWHKTNFIPMCNNTFYPDTEYIIKFKDKGSCFNTGLKKEQATYNTYWIIESLKGKKKEGIDHPTIKPLKIITECLFISSNMNDIVVDLFAGSGSTLIACQKTNRTCYGMELDPHYIDVIIKRYINYTGSTDNCFLIRDNEKIPLRDIKEL